MRVKKYFKIIIQISFIIILYYIVLIMLLYYDSNIVFIIKYIKYIITWAKISSNTCQMTHH